MLAHPFLKKVDVNIIITYSYTTNYNTCNLDQNKYLKQYYSHYAISLHYWFLFFFRIVLFLSPVFLTRMFIRRLFVSIKL